MNSGTSGKGYQIILAIAYMCETFKQRTSWDQHIKSSFLGDFLYSEAKSHISCKKSFLTLIDVGLN